MIRAATLLHLALLGVLVPSAWAQRIEFRGSRLREYELHPTTNSAARWLSARRPGYRHSVEFGRRVVVQTAGTNAPAFGRLTPRLRVKQQVNERTWLLEGNTAQDAVHAAARLSQEAGITLAVPTQRRRVRPHYPLAPVPNDPYFTRQYSLETFDSEAAFLPVSVDLNARAAWAFTRGENVIVGVGDDGIEKTHPDLAANYAGPNYNFLTETPSGDHVARSLYHGTAVAGLIAAVGNNRTGLTGIAPQAKLASWVIFDETDTNEPDESGFAALFGTGNQEVGVQNHSWGNADYSFVEVSVLEDLALEKAVTEGRGGRGVVLVRSAGNTRQTFTGARAGDANLDGYANDPRQVAVAAVRPDGRFASYSTPGSCVLVAAPGGDFRGGYAGLVTTDRVGFAGLNAFRDPDDPSSYDYLVGSRLFVGTSAAAPLVSGVAALVISARPELRWFEVQQILALSARHLDLSDVELGSNGAGFRVSPNTGFGIPDAGTAVRLARSWILQFAPETLRITNAEPQVIPDPLPGGIALLLRREFAVTNTLVLQHVQLRVDWSHPRGRDLQVTLTSPSGWKSSLLRPGTESEPVLGVWTFSSAHHLGETSFGTWALEILDTVTGQAGQLEEATLILGGRALIDTDHDGLEDSWEQTAFGSLSQGPAEDPDGDGWNNASEHLAGRDPTQREEAFELAVGREKDGRLRLTWPGTAQESYQVWATSGLGRPATLVTNVPGRFPEAGWRLEARNGTELYEVRRSP